MPFAQSTNNDDGAYQAYLADDTHICMTRDNQLWMAVQKMHIVMHFAALYIADHSGRHESRISHVTEGRKKAMHACMAD